MLETVELTYSLNGRVVLEKLNVAFDPGRLYGLYGPNGSGKTTLFKLLKKLLTPTSGNIFWNKNPLSAMGFQEISRTIAMVPQNPTLHFPYTVQEFILMGRYPIKAPLSASLYQDVLTMTSLHSLLKEPVNAISGGEKQRAYIARSLLAESPVMLFDEPTANLDQVHQKNIRHLLNDLAKEGKTVIVATHDPKEHYAFDEVIDLGLKSLK